MQFKKQTLFNVFIFDEVTIHWDFICMTGRIIVHGDSVTFISIKVFIMFKKRVYYGSEILYEFLQKNICRQQEITDLKLLIIDRNLH